MSEDEDNNICSFGANNNVETQEKLIEAANFHVMQAQKMRALAQLRAKQAAEDHKSNTPHNKRQYTLVGDYAQNLGVPHFGKEQPGDVYYFSELAIYLFGMVDTALDPNVLDAYAYTEGVGSKGGNNVASLIMHNLKKKGWLKDDETGYRLTLIFDNCAGQNKNNSVLRLANFLVELEYFEEVEIMFYVRGHTKNACDRLFNQLKLQFHPSNVMTFRHAIAKLWEAKNVNVVAVTERMFHDWNELLDTFYTKIKSGTISNNHVFRC